VEGYGLKVLGGASGLVAVFSTHDSIIAQYVGTAQLSMRHMMLRARGHEAMTVPVIVHDDHKV